MKFKHLILGLIASMLLISCSNRNSNSNSTNNSSNINNSSSNTSTSNKNKYTINFDLNGGKSSSYNGSQVVEEFTKDIFFFDCLKDGFNFRGWSYNGVIIFDEKGNQLANPTLASTMTFVAEYSNTAKLTINSNIPEAGRVTGEGEYNFNSNISLTCEVNQGYSFLGWYYQDNTLISKQLSCSFKIENEDVAILAKFDYESFTLSVETYNKTLGLVAIKDNSSAYEESSESKIKYKSSITIMAKTISDTPFLGWFDESGILIETNATYDFVMPYNDYKLVAKWNSFKLNVTSNDETLGTVNNVVGDYSSGAKVDLIATPNENCLFVGWYSDDKLISSSLSFKYEMGSYNVSLLAKFKLKSFNVNVYSSDSTKGSVAGSGDYEYGSKVTLTATAIGSYQFKGWYIDNELISKNNPYTFDIGNADLLIEGRFSENLYTIKFVTNGGDPIDDLVAENGEAISINPRRTGYTFDGWYTDPNLSSTSYFELGKTMPAYNGTLYAKWSIINYTITYHLDIRTINNASNPETYNIDTETITLLNPTVSHGTFSGWFTDEEYKNSITQIVKGTTGNLDLYAKIIDNIYTITFVTNDGDTISPISGIYGEPIKLPKATKTNFVFVGWFIDSTLKTKANFTTMPGDNVTLYAKWAEMYKVFEMDSTQYIYFGSYPQSVVSDSNLISKLDTYAATNSRGYYEYKGNEYAKIKVSAYESTYTYADGSSIENGTTKYFKVEPILWRVLKTDSLNNYTLLAEQIVNTHRYNESYNGVKNGYYANNYKNSEIRTWLNKDFLNSAFQITENSAILTSNVDNSASTTKSNINQFACENTNDKVYFLSYRDFLNADYGFLTSASSSLTRTSKPTDYALANYCSIKNGNGTYWTRSPHSYYSYFSWLIDSDGCFYHDGYINFTNFGIRPALTINL